MRPAKIGQLCAIDNRPQPIDRSNSVGAGAPVIPTALRAWLCGQNSHLSVADVYDADGGGRDSDGSEIAARSQIQRVSGIHAATIVNARPMLIQEARTATHFVLDSGSTKCDDSSTDCQISLQSGVSESGTGNTEQRSSCIDIEPEEEYKSDDKVIETTSSLHNTNIQLLDKSYSDNNNCFSTRDTESHAFLPSISNEVNVFNGEYSGDIKWKSRFLVNDAKLSLATCEQSFLPFEEANEYVKTLTSSVENCGIEMNLQESVHSFLYTNFSNADSSSSSGENSQQKECSRCENEHGQKMVVDTGNNSSIRLSHQYLNSSVTGQTVSNCYLDSAGCFRYLQGDGQLLTCSDCTLQPHAFFTATSEQKMNLNGDSFTILEPSSPKTHFNHYYNKSLVLQPLTTHSSPSGNMRNQHNYHSISKTVFASNDNSAHTGKLNHDLDMVLFQNFSQQQCPAQGSPGILPHHYPHSHQPYQHPDHEQQHLLNHCQLRHHNRQYLQQHHNFRHYSISSVSSLIHHLKCGRRWLHVSPVSLLWAFLSVLVAGSCLLSFLTPYWTIHPDHIHSFGLFNLCIRDLRFTNTRPLCMNFGYQHYYISTRFVIASAGSNTSLDDVAVDTGSVDIARIPSGAWQAACLLFGLGVVVQILAAVVALAVLVLRHPWHHRVAGVNGYVQTVGVLLLVSGLILYPVGFNSPFFTYYCDSSRAFCPGHCAMGWSYVMAIMTTAVSVFCPVMSNFVEAHHGAKKRAAIVETATA